MFRLLYFFISSSYTRYRVRLRSLLILIIVVPSLFFGGIFLGRLYYFNSKRVNLTNRAETKSVPKSLEVQESINQSRYENEDVYLFRNREGKNTTVGYRGYVRSLDSATRSIQIYWPKDSNSSYSIRVPTDTTFLFAGQDTVALMKSVQGDLTKIDSQLSYDDIRPGDFIQLSLMDDNVLFVYRKKT